ncbi:MAG: L-aspartate oxidase [Gemmatimonadetes bacterium]|nr:L-aspartate oxidase [Gemmatimonadota bacterium]
MSNTFHLADPATSAPAIEADVVVVGSGMAGLTFALEVARGASVLLLTKKARAESNTNWARGGIAAVVGSDDAIRLHLEDTLVAGAGLCHPEVVRAVVADGPARIADLEGWGAAFDREGGRLSLGREGGHSRRRIVHAGDRTGRAVESALLERASAEGLEILEDHRVEELVVVDTATGPGVRGVVVVDDVSGIRRLVRARAVFLATGGCGQVYRHTTNPSIATGDGVAMAYRAGARIANMEFVQFHPTALHPTDDPAVLISEALRGEGAVLERLDGARFMDDHHPLGSLAPRDVVARAIARELRDTADDHVMLDVGGIGSALLTTRFAGTVEDCLARGVDPLEGGIPVVPAAHYACGGIWTDLHGRSTLDGLFAAGEVACTGLHGANRLASNSLLEAVVMADRAASALREVLMAEGRWGDRPAPPQLDVPAAQSGGRFVDPGAHATRVARGEGSGGGTAPAEIEESTEVAALRDLMWEKAGIVRTVTGLEEAREALLPLHERGPHDAPLLSSLATTALLIVSCALARRESRGLHWLEDHPWRDNEGALSDTFVEGPSDGAGGGGPVPTLGAREGSVAALGAGEGAVAALAAREGPVATLAARGRR